MAEISVIIPAWNAADTLKETLDSVVNQTQFEDCEVIVIDDGSTDNTADIAQNHPAQADVFSQKNSGVASASNNGVARATGNYIAFLDSDDIWMPQKTELQRRFLDCNPDVVAVFGHTQTFECPTIVSSAFERLSYQKGTYPGYLVSTMMIRSAVARTLQFDTALSFGFFIDWYRRLQETGAKIVMLDEIVHRRRIRPGTLSMMKNESSEKSKSDFLAMVHKAILSRRLGK